MSIVDRSNRAHCRLHLRTFAALGALSLSGLGFACGGSEPSGEGGGGGGGTGGSGGGDVLSCPASPSIERIATGLYEPLPGFPGPGVARITSVLVSGTDVYYIMGDQNGPSIRRVSGGQDTLFLQTSDHRPMSQLVSSGSRLYWFDEAVQPGRVLYMPIDGGAPEIAFDGVRMGMLQELEQYFDGPYAHYIHANTPTADGHWQNQILRRDGIDGSIRILYSRDNGVSGEAFGLHYALLGSRFFVVGPPDNGSSDYRILAVDKDGPAVDPAAPPSIAASFDFTCGTMLARGEDLLWCLRPFEGAMDQAGDRIRVMSFGSDGASLGHSDVFSLDSAPFDDGALTGKAATDGDNLFFVTAKSDGTGNVTSVLYRTTALGGGAYRTTVLACDLPEIVDLTIGNHDVTFAAFEPEPDKVDRNGVFRIPY